jgi:hypothetical protein
MNFNKSAIATSAAILTVLTACVGPQPGTPSYVAMQEEDRQKAAIKVAQESVAKAPSWYLQPPVDANSIYAAGTETSSDMQMSMDMAVLSAKRTLAAQIGNRLSSKMKEFAMQVGSNDDNQVTKEIERVTTNVITEVNLAGFTREKSELIPQGKGYRTYVLLRYPLGDSNRMIVDQMKKSAVLDAKLRASEAFKELEKEIESAKPAR